MKKLTERDIIDQFIGKAVNQDHLINVGYHNGGDNYIVCNADYIEKPQYIKMFGITDRQKWIWGYNGIDFSLYLTLDNGAIKNCHLYKSREGGGGHGRPTSTVLVETQQELRIARRILEYITL